MNNGPVLIVDDDGDDKQLLKDAWEEMGFPNELLFFNTGEEVIEYLNSGQTVPFLILCDVNIPRMDGFALKEKLLEDTTMNYKSIPFVFWSSEVSKKQIRQAYDLGVNGFFIKGSSFVEIKESLRDIVAYWWKSKVPM